MFGGRKTNIIYWNIKDIANVFIGAVGTVGALKIMYDSTLSEEERTARREASLFHKVKEKARSRIEDRFDL